VKVFAATDMLSYNQTPFLSMIQNNIQRIVALRTVDCTVMGWVGQGSGEGVVEGIQLNSRSLMMGWEGHWVGVFFWLLL
jgi:hypothetical protein